MRIVYDGAPEAGKTTNVAWLTGQVGLLRRGSVESPGTSGRRTEYFDWLDFAGGYVDGRRVRCQLLSVPGQPQLLRRRRYLLESADAAVHVVDSRPEQLTKTRDNLARSRKLLAALGGSVEAGFVVQANKQDLPGALSIEALARELSLPADVAIVPAIARSGEGVMSTLMLAARLATDRVRALLAGTRAFDQQTLQQSPGELYRALQGLEPERPVKDSASGGLLPASLDGVAHDVFPPVKGRGLLSRADVESAAVVEQACAWAPPDAVELTTAAGYRLHSADRWRFDDAEAARRQLLELVRRQRAWAELGNLGRALFIVVDETRRLFRIWILTAPVTLLTDALEQRLKLGDHEAAALARERLARFEQRALELSLGVELAELGEAPGGIVGLAIDEGERSPCAAGQLCAELDAWLSERALWLPP